MAYAIGARSQSARTYLEKHYKTYETASLDTLLLNALSAVKTSSDDDEDFNANSVELAYLGKDQAFKTMTVAEK